MMVIASLVPNYLMGIVIGAGYLVNFPSFRRLCLKMQAKSFLQFFECQGLSYPFYAFERVLQTVTDEIIPNL